MAENGCGGALHRPRNAVEFCRLTAVPKRMQAVTAAPELLGDHRVAAARAGKAGGFGERAQFDRTFPRTVYGKDRARTVVCDKGFIGRVIEDHRVVFQGVFYPRLQLLCAVCGAGRVIGRAKIDDVRLDAFIGHGEKVVFLIGSRINDAPACHDVRVHIDRIDRVGDKHRVVLRENIGQVAAVGFCAVGHKDLIGGDLYAKALIIPGDRLADKIIALVFGIALEGILVFQVLAALLHGFHHDRRKRQGNVADA